MTSLQRRRRQRLTSLVRAPIWWTPKVLPVIAVACLGALTAGVSATDGLPRVAAMLVSAAGVAAFAHVVNDLSDREADQLAGKRNVVSELSTTSAFAVLIACLTLSALPWILVPIGAPAALTLILIVGTTTAYSMPPLRLKQRGLVGVVADAAVAHLLPTAFAMLLMGSAGTATSLWWTATVASGVWAFGFGVRSIVVHQILDLNGDVKAGVETLVSRRGVHRSSRIGRDAFGLECVGLVALWVVVAFTSWGAALFFAIHFALWLNHRRWDRTPIDSVPKKHGQWLPLAEFYEVWPAVVLCVALASREFGWIWLLGAVLLLFWPAIEKQALDQIAMLAEFASWLLNLLLPVLEKLGIRTGMTARSIGGGVVTAAWSVRSALNRIYHRIRIALREAWFSTARAWWALYRAVWRLRHKFDPAVAFFRRQRRRARRILRDRAEKTAP